MKRGSMKRRKSGQRALVAYLCHFRPEPRRRVHGHLPQAASGGDLYETLEEAQANAREAIELCLEVMREDGQPIPPADWDLASPIDQLVSVASGAASRHSFGRGFSLHRIAARY